MSGAILLQPMLNSNQYETRQKLTLDLDMDGGISGSDEGQEKSTTLRSEDSGIVLITEIQRDEKTHFPRSPGFHFGLDEESVRPVEDDDTRGHDESPEVTCPSPEMNSVSSADGSDEYDPAKRNSDQWCEAEDSDTEEDEWAMFGKMESPREIPEPVNQADAGKKSTIAVRISPVTVDFVTGRSPCTDAFAAVDILRTRYQLSDVAVRNANSSRECSVAPAAPLVSAVPKLVTRIPVSRLYDRPQYDYFGSKQLKEMSRAIEIRDRQLSIILDKILAEEEKARYDEEKAKAAAAAALASQTGDLRVEGPAWVVPELDFFTTTSPSTFGDRGTKPSAGGGAGMNDVTKSRDEPVKSGVDEPDKKKNKNRSLLRRAINGLRKSFRRRPSSRP